MEIKVIRVEKIEATEFSMEANILTLSNYPTDEEKNVLIGDDESIVLEF